MDMRELHLTPVIFVLVMDDDIRGIHSIRDQSKGS